ncbi:MULTISPECIES: transporter substrate-binding domain-containing protein [Rhizobium]|jgi:polar amino acid transport system substrate-binding protein|uniref:Amino acid ABC transporter n=1 Tax=Rhizobium tropici TaxID=398 RepID=A0A329Y655_RHITR|nr:MULTISPECIES: transporter substrate-binding domain-containing protein [Rhizobium]MBB3287539.1 polar amino acid transport system substrate-binding protein [Rhizobium sp. BK252]MBB3402279.1 polar amino acid transport system substrate-binding protein [Rhizobium sp. BK289]MBB3414856.1 polar amino acid transport system substrate-binding protein [Rhizobium sp. BK284]MBB3482745.1 polar amino acid transport system substrate-binding protein [Rhizobium sp. BK347]MDK4721820.1 transporter substrate-bin
MRVCLSSPISVARVIAHAALIAVSCALPLSAQETKPSNLPILFDARERLPKPDLSSLVRLRFLTSTDFPPFNFLDQNGKLTGFHVELARKICDELDIADKCQIQALPFGELQGALAASQGDAVIAGVAVTPELRKSFAFSRPFMTLPARFVRNLKASVSGTTAASLSGHSVGVVRGTVHEAMLTAFFPAIKPVPFDDKDALLTAVKDGKVDAAFADGLQLSFWVSSPAAEKCCALFDGPYLSQQFLGEGMTIMLRQQDADLTAAINHALAMLSRDGRLQEIYLRYFPYGLY